MAEMICSVGIISNSDKSLIQPKNAITFAGTYTFRSGMLEISWRLLIKPQSRDNEEDSMMFTAKVTIDAVVTVS